MGVIGILVVSTVGDLQQSRSSLQLSQARAVAEAGIAVGHDALQGTGNTSLQNTLNGFSTSFANAGSNPTTTWVVPQSSWNSVASSLQTALNTTAASNSVTSSTLGGVGSASVIYQLSNFRGRLLAPTSTSSTQSYVMDYTITSTGSANGATRNVTEQGSFTIQMGQGSLNRYLFLVNNSNAQAGGFYNSGNVFNGPVHSNTSWGFSGNPQFLGPVTTASNQTFYTCFTGSGRNVTSTLTPLTTSSNPPCSSPNYAQGFQFNQPTIPLPTSALGQARAALGLDPTVSTNGVPNAPTALETCQKLNLSATCSASSPAPATGVYLPGSNTTPPAITGGIYIQGNVTGMTLDRPAANQQRYTIVQGTTTSVILVNYANNTTTITRTPGGTTNYTGTPNGHSPTGGGANGQIFVNGTVSGLTGPARPNPDTTPANGPQNPLPSSVRPALAKETQLNITATGQVGVTGDLTYECDPTQLSVPTYITANPNCNMNGQPLNTVLGVMSTGSNVQIQSTAPRDIYLWGSYYTATTNMGLTVQGVTGMGRNPTRGASGTMHLFGGLIQNQDQTRGYVTSTGTLTNGFTESFNYDTRFANGAVTPPNFPTTRNFSPTVGAPIPINFSEK
jgi:Domain of unknown function (DUF4900)